MTEYKMTKRDWTALAAALRVAALHKTAGESLSDYDYSLRRNVFINAACYADYVARNMPEQGGEEDGNNR